MHCYCGETDTIWCRGDINPFKLPFPPNADITFLDWQRCLIPRVEIGIFDVFSNLTDIDLRGQLIEFECESLTLIPNCISVQADCHFKSSSVSHEVTTTKFDLTSEPITLNTERVPGDSTLSYSNPVNLTTPSHVTDAVTTSHAVTTFDSGAVTTFDSDAVTITDSTHDSISDAVTTSDSTRTDLDQTTPSHATEQNVHLAMAIAIPLTAFACTIAVITAVVCLMKRRNRFHRQRQLLSIPDYFEDRVSTIT